MSPTGPTEQPVSIHISRSSATTAENKTGSWRFFRPRYEEATAPCSAACPAGEDIGRIQMMAGRRLFSAAGRIVLTENPFPAVCGRVCFHPCESVCNRSVFDQAVAVQQVERLVGDRLLAGGGTPAVDSRSESGRRAAVVGAGPAGLAAAYFLRRLGHACEVFEAAPEPGGVLRWGIPAYRLPPAVLAAEITRIAAMGVEIRCGSRLPADFLRSAAERYDALVVACGHGRRIALQVPGNSLAMDGLALLAQVRRGDMPALDGPVAVIGGGNTAVDVARTLLRLGAEPVIHYRRRRCDMPAFAEEVETALEEGVRIVELTAPIAIDESVQRPGWYALALQRMTPVGEAPDGRCRVAPARGAAETHLFRAVVTAVGADAELPWGPAPDGDALCLSHCRMRFDPLPTAWGGDLTNRYKSVADAVASGKQAALALDACFSYGPESIAARLEACRVGPGPALSMEAYLDGPLRRRSRRTVGASDINRDYFEPADRLGLDFLPLSRRRGSFEPVEVPPSAVDIAAEAGRCFNCGSCNACDNCRIFCPEVAVCVKGGERWVDLDYCKGCGICVTECPRRAMVMEQEVS